MTAKQKVFKFGELVTSIESVHSHALSQSSKAVNISLTMRNWLIGCYICEFELKGADRANYGENLLASLADALKSTKLTRVGAGDLHRYKQFYKYYPQIQESLSNNLIQLLPYNTFNIPDTNKNNCTNPIVATVSRQLQLPATELVTKLSYSHLSELFSIHDNAERFFYEVECIRGNWSVRELRRQIQSLYYQRSEMSRNKEKLAELANQNSELQTPELTFQDPMIFEFIGFKRTEPFTETDLENARIDRT